MATKKKKYQDGGNSGNQKRTNSYEQTKTGYTGPGSGAMSINDIKATTSKTNRKGNTVTKTFTGSGAQAGDVSGKGTRLKNAASGTKTKTVTDAQGNVIKSKTKNISGNRATKKILNIRDRSNTSESYGSAPGVYKTGGMVNPNAKMQAQKAAGSKGVKPGVNPKAAASKVAKGRSGGTSAAPKTALPKAQKGWSVTDPYKSGKMGEGASATKTTNRKVGGLSVIHGGTRTKTIKAGGMYPGAKGSINVTKTDNEGRETSSKTKYITQKRANRMIDRKRS